jgi:hypothetical protein
VVVPHELLVEKAARHRAYILAWAKQHNFDPEVVWQAREKCIEALSTHAGQQRA